MTKILCICCVLPAAPSAGAADVRPMWTDRPDQTESPYTVPAGLFQLEASLVSFSRSLGSGPATESWDWAASTMKLGLTADVDAQLVFSPFVEMHELGQSTLSGVSDLQIRLKWNVFGNDAGSVALALLPYVKAPAASGGLGNGDWEGGLLVPVTWQFSEQSYLAAMAFVGINADQSGARRAEPGLSISLGRDLSEHVGAYVEVLAQHRAGNQRDALVAFDGGLTWALSDNVQLDVGVNWFVAGDRRVNPFLGLSFRL